MGEWWCKRCGGTELGWRFYRLRNENGSEICSRPNLADVQRLRREHAWAKGSKIYRVTRTRKGAACYWPPEAGGDLVAARVMSDPLTPAKRLREYSDLFGVKTQRDQDIRAVLDALAASETARVAAEERAENMTNRVEQANVAIQRAVQERDEWKAKAEMMRDAVQIQQRTESAASRLADAHRGEEKPAAYARFSGGGETLGLAFEPDDVTPAVRDQLEPLYRRPAPSPSARRLADMHDAHKAEIAKLKAEVALRERERQNAIADHEEKRDDAARMSDALERRAEAAEVELAKLKIEVGGRYLRAQLDGTRREKVGERWLVRRSSDGACWDVPKSREEAMAIARAVGLRVVHVTRYRIGTRGRK